MQASKILIPLNIVIIVICAFWYYQEPGYKPIVTILATIGTLIAQILTKNKRDKDTNSKMNQSSGDNSKNYQAGGDVNINTKKND
ncbi:MAG TPA: hypothetical protein VK553_02350 [Candidatus Nitrosopolaris rasttigaisensis]|nr:hypothetical protein [Candidatus Nitrosopolaris rasttigaisensis]